MATAVRWQIKWSAVALLSALTIAFAAAAIASAQTSDADEGRVTVDDCFGQLLVSDALHCQIFTELHNAGTLTVGQIYLVNNVLYIYITEPESELDAINETIAARGLEAHAAASDPDWECDALTGCYPGSLVTPQWKPILPYSVQYTNIALRAGGAAALRLERGWASFEQVWPVPAGGDNARTAPRSETAAPLTSATATPPSSVDVSDIDTANIPEIECNVTTLGIDRSGSACRYWTEYPHLRIADWRSVHGKAYIDVKVPADRPASGLAAARRFIVEEHYGSPADASFIHVNAVSYDYADQYRWATILRRFIYSRGNTTGITWVQRHVNYAGGIRERTHFPLPDLQPIADYDTDQADVRSTLAVITLEFEETIAALPQILKALGIPVEAVGLVWERNQNPPRGPGIAHVADSVPESDAEPDEVESQPGPLIVPANSGVPARVEGLTEVDAGDSQPESPAWQPWWLAPIGALAAFAAIGLFIRTIKRRKSKQ